MRRAEKIVDYLNSSDDVFFVASGEVWRHHLLGRRSGGEISESGSGRNIRRICRYRRRTPFSSVDSADELPHRLDIRQGILASSWRLSRP